ncbi:MAG: hypothetical protein ABIB93_04250 [Chloroflexota bacterium]
MLKRISIVFGVLLAMCVACYIVYNVATVTGEFAGYNRGYADGQEVGYRQGDADGQEVGYRQGYTAGQEAGYSTGRTDGNNEGFASGIKEGHQEGYDEGYQSGVDASLGHGYTLKDPTYADALAFLARDKTDENEYRDPVYVCSHFAQDVCNTAEADGMRCAFVDIRFPSTAHALVAFETIDKGLVYFEPQFDEVVKPVIGKRLYQCIEPKEGYYYDPPSYDDTINDILVIW